MKLGIVGLPNVGKSTLFNSLTKAGAESANYPFCTIDPNVGVVTVPDERLNVLGEMYHTKKIIPAAIEFVDIAGLVKYIGNGEYPPIIKGKGLSDGPPAKGKCQHQPPVSRRGRQTVQGADSLPPLRRPYGAAHGLPHGAPCHLEMPSL